MTSREIVLVAKRFRTWRSPAADMEGKMTHEMPKTVIWRKGGTAKRYRPEPKNLVEVKAHLYGQRGFTSQLRLSFSIPVPRGSTDVMIQVDRSDFEKLATEMAKTDFEAAARAFSKALFFSPKSKEIEKRIYGEG